MNAPLKTLELPQDVAGQSLAASPFSAILDVTMGHRGMQKEMRERFGIDGPITSMDIREVMGNGMRPDVVADSRDMPFPDASFDLVMFDPPFSFHNSKSCGNGQYNRFYVTYGLNLYTSRAELGEYIRGTFKEIARVLTPDGQCVMKWSEGRIKLDFPLSLAGHLVEVKRWQRPSKHWGTKAGTATWYVWFSLPNKSRSATRPTRRHDCN